MSCAYHGDQNRNQETLINPFNQAIVHNELKIAIKFMMGEVDGVAFVKTDCEFPVTTPEKSVSECNLKIVLH